MLTKTERQERIAKIKGFPVALESTVQRLTNEQLDTPYRAGGWTVRQVVHHLADSHMNAFVRMKLILTEDKPTLKPYNQDEWAKLPDTAKMPIEQSLTILKGLHSRWTVLLESVPDERWNRVAIHPEHGEVTIESMLTTYARHGEKHIGHINGLLTTKGW